MLSYFGDIRFACCRVYPASMAKPKKNPHRTHIRMDNGLRSAAQMDIWVETWYLQK
jgi:hypothetical protein